MTALPRRRPPGRAPRSGRTWRVAPPIVLVAGAVLFFVLAGDPPSSPRIPPGPAPSPLVPVADRAPPARPEPSARPAAPVPAGDEIAVAALRVERARKTLDDYIAATRYPPVSRPIAEHPDLIRPLHPVDHAQPLRPGGVARLRVRYDRTFLTDDDAVRIAVRGEDEAGNALPSIVLESTAAEAPFSPEAGRRGPAALAFTADGAGGHSAVFIPARQGFAGHLGPIRVALRARVAGEEGSTSFDVYYTPSPPARFTGTVREVLAGGSLEWYAGIDVRKPGRYLVDARAADATGEPFAFLSFNEELPAGRGEVRLVLFGKLVRDKKAAAPFTLRDVEGLLLKEDTDPDRETLAPLLGPVHTSRDYPDSAFSTVEWQSEERSRHIEEFTRNLKELTAAAGK